MKNYNSRTNRVINPIHYHHIQTSYLTLEDTIVVGKYSGKTLKEILLLDLHYVKWAMKNGVIRVSLSAMGVIRDEIKKHSKIYTDEEKAAFNERDNKRRAEFVKVKEKKGIPIFVFDENKYLINSFETIIQTAKELQLSESTISHAIKSKQLIKEKYYFAKSEFAFNIF